MVRASLPVEPGCPRRARRVVRAVPPAVRAAAVLGRPLGRRGGDDPDGSGPGRCGGAGRAGAGARAPAAGPAPPGRPGRLSGRPARRRGGRRTRLAAPGVRPVAGRRADLPRDGARRGRGRRDRGCLRGGRGGRYRLVPRGVPSRGGAHGRHRLAAEGSYLSFDTFGKHGYQDDGTRLRLLLALLEAGHADRILLSCDVSRHSHLSCRGGTGYGHLFRTVLPRLRAAGVPDGLLDRMTGRNPLRFLTGTGAGSWVSRHLVTVTWARSRAAVAAKQCRSTACQVLIQASRRASVPRACRRRRHTSPGVSTKTITS